MPLAIVYMSNLSPRDRLVNAAPYSPERDSSIWLMRCHQKAQRTEGQVLVWTISARRVDLFITPKPHWP